jgi:hypothetical protein
MGNSTITSEPGAKQLAASLQTLTETMTTMKRDLDLLRSGNSDQSGGSTAKRSRISPERDLQSACTSDDDELINNYLEENNAEAPEGDTTEWFDIDDFFEGNKETGEELSKDLASLAYKVLRAKPKEDKAKSLALKHKRPCNVENLQVPKVEEHLWRQLKRNTKAFDYAMQRMQGSICQAVVPVIKLVQKMKTESVSSELRELTGDTFKMLAQTVVHSNDARMEKIKKDLLLAYRPLCTNKPSATKLLTTASTKKSFLHKRGGAHAQNYQTYNNRSNQGPMVFSPRTNKFQSAPKNQHIAKRGKPMRK